MNFKKIIAAAALSCAAAVSISGCGCSYGVHDSGSSSGSSLPTPAATDFTDISALVSSDALDVIIPAEINLSNGVVLHASLFPNNAPATVSTFTELAESGFYNNTVIYTVDDDSRVYFGKYNSDMSLNASQMTLNGEFHDNGIENNLMFMNGVLGFNNDGADYNSIDGEFFICATASFESDGKFAAFGILDPDGMEDLQALAESPSSAVDGVGNVIDGPVTISSISIGEQKVNE